MHVPNPILRIWAVRIRDGGLPAYLDYAREHSRAMFLSQRGCLGVFFLQMDDGRHAACSLWRDPADIDALSASESYLATAAGLMALGVIEGEPEVQVHAIHGGAVASPSLEHVLGSLDRGES